MKHCYILLFLTLLFSACTREEKDLARYVDPFIGTGGHGHTYPGASMPFGMVQLSPDTRLEGWDGCAGYHYDDSVVYGFSHTHLNGTGIPDYCDILFMPTVGEIQIMNGCNDPDEGYASRFSHDKETAEPGYYRTWLDDEGITVELTVTKRAGMHRYTFPESDSSHVIIDLHHRDRVIESFLRIVSDTEVEGYRRSSSWANDQRIYFVARFSESFAGTKLFIDDQEVRESRTEGTNVKACLTFHTGKNESVMVKVGLSSVSIAGARKNLETEIPDWDFDKVRHDVRAAWNAELGKILVEGGSDEQKTVFYTALYHAFLTPNLFMDADSSYLGMDFQVHKAENHTHYTVFSLWDTFRAEHPLLTLVQQQRTLDFIRTFLHQYEQGGRLPVWELAANETDCMIGYHSIPVIVDAYQKGIRDFDIDLAYEAMKHSAMLDHFGLKSYQENGYIPAEDEAESVSRTLEYAYDDWCIARMAEAPGKEEDYELFIKRAQSWKNIYDPSTGFMRAKMNGRWFSPFDPREVNFTLTEANSWQYSFFVPHDISGLKEYMGGDDAFSDKLDLLFSETSETTGREQSDITGMIGQYAHGNEPSHHMAYLYSYVGKPWKTQEVVRKIMTELYTGQPDGLCGNEDCGQMSAWYALSAMGIYPVCPGDNTYVLGSPLFKKVTLQLENGHTFVIKALNNNNKNIYVHVAFLNGNPYSRSYIMHDDIMNGGELVLEMSSEPAFDRGKLSADIPGSAIGGHLIETVPYLVTGDRTFTDSVEIIIAGTPNSRIFYTTDGSVPDERSAEYFQPLKLSESLTLKAISVRGNIKSSILSADFIQLPKGRNIRLGTAYAGQYAAGGDRALIDGLTGPLNFRTGTWQGYEGVDLDATVDLGQVQYVKSVSISFLQDNNAWIFLPVEVSFEVSTDGNHFEKVQTVRNGRSLEESGIFREVFKAETLRNARYVRVTALNMGTCPDWHKGSGKKAWIFADEITVE
jgi:predicted alpha-1,2-mannosidase